MTFVDVLSHQVSFIIKGYTKGILGQTIAINSRQLHFLFGAYKSLPDDFGGFFYGSPSYITDY